MAETTPEDGVLQTNTSNNNGEEPNAKEEWEQQRDSHKAKGDDAFRSKNFSNAISEYTNAITFDPEMHILYSNRSAAYLANSEKSRALADAKKCVELKPDFVKGHSRLAAAMLSLGRWNEAKGVYRHILNDLDKGNAVAKRGLEDCRARELKAKELEREILHRAQKSQKTEEEQKSNAENNDTKDKNEGQNDDEDEDDLLNDFFDEVEEAIEEKKQIRSGQSEKQETKEEESGKENKIQIQLTDLGDTKTQIQRILCSNHEWYNLNPFRVLDISPEAPMELLSRRYKALSLLLHPDKVRSTNSDSEVVEKAELAFEYVRKANNTLKDESKAQHTVDLIEQGLKQGKRDYETAQKENSTNGKNLERFQEIATMKIFAEIERKRRDVERRKRKFEEREREQEDAEVNKSKKERDFEKNWKQDDRVNKRINNWRDFKKKS